MTDKELVERLRRNNAGMGVRNPAGYILTLSVAEANEIADRLEALSRDRAGEQEPVAVKVKPLEWEQPDGPEGTAWIGHGTDMCQYYIRFDTETASYWLPGEPPRSNDDDSGQEFLALDEAKAAAQADYERRILSALASPVSTADVRRQALARAGLPSASDCADWLQWLLDNPRKIDGSTERHYIENAIDHLRSLVASPPVPDPRDAEIMDECKFLVWLLDTIGEININNYNHDDVCRMNETNVEAILAILARITALDTGKGGE